MSKTKQNQMFHRQPGQPMTLAEYKAIEDKLTRPLTDRTLPVMRGNVTAGNPRKVDEIRPVMPVRDRNRGKR